MNKRLLTFPLLGLLAISSFGFAFHNVSKVSSNIVEVNAAAPSKTYTNHDGDTYYNGIDDSLEGEDLLAALRSLNKSRRKSTVGYSAMGTSTSGMFRYTDYVPSTVKYDSNNQPYGTAITSFYSGNSCASFNREHVWPNSHGGNVVEADIHMPRPTIPSENGSRGNSFYVEGMKDDSLGWDPAMEDFGKEDYRGDSARIIFYSVIADSRLDLIDETYHQTSKANRDYLMGKLSDMLKWNLKYPVLEREQNRNEGAEYLQGNRNPFIDHPEYACKIWGNTNGATQSICSSQPEGDAVDLIVTPPTKRTYQVGESLDKTGMKVYLVYENGAKSLLDNKFVAVSPETFTKAGTITVTVTAMIYEEELSATFTVTVSEPIDPPEKEAVGLSIVPPAKKTYLVGETLDRTGMKVSILYNDKSTAPLTSSYTVSPETFTKAGTITVTVTATVDDEELTGTFTVSVSDRSSQDAIGLRVVPPTKREYKLGESLDKTGMEVYLVYEDESSSPLSLDLVAITPEKFEESGTITVTVTAMIYEEELSAIFTVTVSAPPTSPKGCGGDIATTSVILSSLAFVGATGIIVSTILRKKKKEY